MKKIVLFMMIFFLSTIASANELPTSQWKVMNGASLYGLVSAGFHIVSVTSEDIAQDTGGYTYFLQKSSRVVKCSETYVIDLKHRKTTSLFMCWQLVPPY